MKLKQPVFSAPADAAARLGVEPVICYPVDTLPPAPMDLYASAAEGMELVGEALRGALGLPRDPRAALEGRGHAVVWSQRQASALESLAAGDPQPLRRLLRTRD